MSSATKGCGGVKGTRVAIVCILLIGILNVSFLLSAPPSPGCGVPFGAPCLLAPAGARLSPLPPGFGVNPGIIITVHKEWSLPAGGNPQFFEESLGLWP